MEKFFIKFLKGFSISFKRILRSIASDPLAIFVCILTCFEKMVGHFSSFTDSLRFFLHEICLVESKEMSQNFFGAYHLLETFTCLFLKQTCCTKGLEGCFLKVQTKQVGSSKKVF